MRALFIGISTLLLSPVAGCAGHSDDDAGVTEANLSAGQLDPSFNRAFGGETFVGTRGAKLFFLGRDDSGTYVARRTTTLALDTSYGTNGKSYVAGPWVPRTNNEAPARSWIAAGAVLPDGRVVITGAQEGRGDFVGYGAYVRNASLTLGLVAADGNSKTLDPVQGLPPLPTTGCSVMAHAGTFVLPLADGGLAVGAGANCFSNGWKAARLLHFKVDAGGFAFDRMFWQGENRGIAAGHYGTVAVTSVAEGAPGKFLVTSSGRGGLTLDGDVRATLPTRGYEAAMTSQPDPAGFNPLPILSVGAHGTTSSAARRDDGSLVVASKAARCVGLQHTSANPEVDLAFGAPALPVTCVDGSGAEDVVGLLSGPPGRLLLVTEATDTAFPPNQPPVTTYKTRVRSVDGAGSIDPSFGSAGIVEIASSTAAGQLTASPKGAFAAAGYLYIQLGNKFGDDVDARVRRIKF